MRVARLAGQALGRAALAARELRGSAEFTAGGGDLIAGCLQFGPVTVKVQPKMRTNGGDTCRAVALRGEGLVIQPSFLVGADLRAGTLVELLPAYRSIELGIYAMYPTRKHVLPKVRLLIDFLVEAFRNRAWL